MNWTVKGSAWHNEPGNIVTGIGGRARHEAYEPWVYASNTERSRKEWLMAYTEMRVRYDLGAWGATGWPQIIIDPFNEVVSPSWEEGYHQVVDMSESYANGAGLAAGVTAKSGLPFVASVFPNTVHLSWEWRSVYQPWGSVETNEGGLWVEQIHDPLGANVVFSQMVTFSITLATAIDPGPNLGGGGGSDSFSVAWVWLKDNMQIVVPAAIGLGLITWASRSR